MDVNMFTTPFQLTKSMHRDLYPPVDPSNPALSAKGKVVIVTGAGGGLGAAIARTWAQAGAAGVVLIGRSSDTLKLTADQIAKINQSTTVIAEPTDITNESAVKSLFSKVKEKFGKAQVLVNGAGKASPGTIGEGSVDAWWSDYETNVKGTYITTQAFIQNFGGEGTVINLVSLAASLPGPGNSSYSSTKLALIHIGQCLALECPNLRVYSVHPGIVAADDRGVVIDMFTPFAKDTQALTGGVTLYLDTPKAEFLNGGYLSVNWDVEELEAHAEEIKAGKLNQLAFLNGKLSPEGHPWESK